jgi:hypothetical protein
VANFIDKLEALLREATPGPWEAIRMLVYAHIKNADGHYVAEPLSRKMQFRHVQDAELIALLGTAAPALLEVVRAAQAADNLMRDYYTTTHSVAKELRQALRKLGVGE